MHLMPDSRALLGVDVIASASSPGYHRDRQWGALTAMLTSAFERGGITPDMVVHHEPTGDGALYTLPSDCLGAAVDLTDHLDTLAAEHNRWHKPDIRLRVSIDIGAVGAEPGYYTPKIHLTRMLGAEAFRTVVNNCIRDNTDQIGNSWVSTGLIMSAFAFREVFAGNYTSQVRQTDFVELPVANKQFNETAWVRVPGIDARTLAEYSSVTESTVPTRQSGASQHGPHESGSVVNYVEGKMIGSVQARDITGDIHLGRGR